MSCAEFEREFGNGNEPEEPWVPPGVIGVDKEGLSNMRDVSNMVAAERFSEDQSGPKSKAE